MNQGDPRIRQVIAQIQKEYERRRVHPQYTCPTCRLQVKRKPVEVFMVKNMVPIVARIAGGEESPEAANAGAPRALVGGVWDGFFPG